MLVFCLIIFQFLILQNIKSLLFYFILMAETWMRLDLTRADLSLSPLCFSALNKRHQPIHTEKKSLD